MIIGAGLAGLIGAHVFPRHKIIEASPEPFESHKALLRFRSDAVGRLTGIAFRPVTVRKAIWMEGRFHEPTIQLANLYSQKCLGRFLPRSIWHLEPATRFIAPETFYDQLVDALWDRIEWGTVADLPQASREAQVISTAPLPVALQALNLASTIEFKRASITVERFRVPGADVHQTVYFPTEAHSAYRASITGDLLIVEFVGEPFGDWMEDVDEAFALRGNIDRLGSVEQKYGKIEPVDDSERKAIVARLTTQYNIFSLGRFATWRNLLLDDVLDDAEKIKRLIHASDYDRRLVTS